MADTVFVLGAGASKQGGAPLMGDFLQTALRLWKAGRVARSENAFQAVFQALNVFSSVHSKARLDLDNLESVFAAFEMSRTIGGFAGYDAAGADELTKALKTVIVTTLEETMPYFVAVHTVRAPDPYTAFATLIQRLMQDAKPRHSVAVLTFNYDLAVDFALKHEGLAVDYGLVGQRSNGVRVLKLHGSLHWGRCPKCGQIVDWPLQKFLDSLVPLCALTDRGPEQTRSGKSQVLALSPFLSRHSHCPDSCLDPEPVLVPPTWNKSEYHRALSSVWGRAAKELGEAENIFVIGYSMPPTDVFFNHLYALGAAGGAPLQRFWVCNPDEKAEARFRGIIGQGAENKFSFHPMRFDQAVRDIDNEFFGHSATRARIREY